MLTDVLAVFGGDAGLQWRDARRPARLPLPGPLGRRDRRCVSAECRARDVPSVNVKASGAVLKGCRRADVERAAGR